MSDSTSHPYKLPKEPEGSFTIYFHPGGLSVGKKKSYFPIWLHYRVISLGYGSVSADYQLLPPATAHDIVKDVQDPSLSFITGNIIIGDQNVRIKEDPDRLAVAGGLCAYLAALHASPKPKPLLSIYIWYGWKFFLGVFLDYYTGVHQPSVSKVLYEILDKGDAESNDFKQAIPEIHMTVIPEIMVDENWPPTMLLHGTADTAVPVEESHHLRGLLDAAGVSAHFIVFNGKEHPFYYETDAEKVWKEQFDVVKAFLYKALG